LYDVLGIGIILEQFVLPQVDALNNIATIIEYSPNILGIDGACEMRIAMVSTVATGRRDPLQMDMIDRVVTNFE
jgi:hypothetical protein